MLARLHLPGKDGGPSKVETAAALALPLAFPGQDLPGFPRMLLDVETVGNHPREILEDRDLEGRDEEAGRPGYLAASRD